MTIPKSHGIELKKKHGQNFLRDASVVFAMLDRVTLTHNTSVFEIGPGDGFLTQYILDSPMARLWAFEIDLEWASHLRKRFEGNTHLTVFDANILDVDFSVFESHKPWTLLANLPYHVTFPILRLVQKHRDKIAEGVIMVQEEVAQKIVKKGGRDFGFISLYFQHYFEWELLIKVPPTAFYPAPKVFSRLLYFKPRAECDVIPDEALFWDFIKRCFKQPRRTLKNNLSQGHYHTTAVPEEILALRAQQLDKNDLLKLWNMVKAQ